MALAIVVVVILVRATMTIGLDTLAARAVIFVSHSRTEWCGTVTHGGEDVSDT
jgi:hypothetical protein